MKELWYRIRGFDNYIISNKMNVRSQYRIVKTRNNQVREYTARLLQIGKDNLGRKCVRLSEGGIAGNFTIKSLWQKADKSNPMTMSQIRKQEILLMDKRMGKSLFGKQYNAGCISERTGVPYKQVLKIITEVK